MSALGGANGAAPTPWQLALDQTLRSAWRFALPSFGLTLIWVNIHFCCHYMAGWKSFGPFGKTFRSEYAELILLGLVDALIFIAIVVAITIGWALLNPCDAIAAMLDFKWLAELCSS